MTMTITSSFFSYLKPQDITSLES